jgi:pimeloyl-ACP methyl ester carboxylesterase
MSVEQAERFFPHGFRELTDKEVNREPLQKILEGYPFDVSYPELMDVRPTSLEILNQELKNKGIDELDPHLVPHYSAAVVERKPDSVQSGDSQPDTAIITLSGIWGSGSGIGDMAVGSALEGLKETQDGVKGINPALSVTLGSSVSIDTQDGLRFVNNDWQRAAYQAAFISEILKQHKNVTRVFLVGVSLGGSELLQLTQMLQKLHPDTPDLIKGLVFSQAAGQYNTTLVGIGKGFLSIKGWQEEKDRRFPTPDVVHAAEIAAKYPEGDDPRAALYAERDRDALRLVQKRAYADLPTLKTIDEAIIKARQNQDKKQEQELLSERRREINRYIEYQQQIDKRKISWPTTVLNTARVQHHLTNGLPDALYDPVSDIPMIQVSGKNDEYYPPEHVQKNLDSKGKGKGEYNASVVHPIVKQVRKCFGLKEIAKGGYNPDVHIWVDMGHGEMTVNRVWYGAMLTKSIRYLNQHTEKRTSKKQKPLMITMPSDAALQYPPKKQTIP